MKATTRCSDGGEPRDEEPPYNPGSRKQDGNTGNGRYFTDHESEYLRAVVKWRSDHIGEYMTETDRLRLFIALGYHK